MTEIIKEQVQTKLPLAEIIKVGDWKGNLPFINEDTDLEELGMAAVGIGLTVAAVGAGILIYNALKD